MLAEDNVRKGFFERAQFEAVRDEYAARHTCLHAGLQRADELTC
jgi:hypothetical protein